MRADDKKNGEIPLQARATGARDYLELWINLARREWGSLVVVPADRDGSTAEIANALADIGQRLSYGPVTAITVSALEYGSALALADLQQHVERERRNSARTTQVVNVSPSASRSDPAPGGDTEAAPEQQSGEGVQPSPDAPPAETVASEPTAEGGDRSQALIVAPPARLIISVPPVVVEPLGLTAVEEADAVVLAIRMNYSKLLDVRRTIELVGRDRVTGCFLVR